ncbi:MAG: hypothetical protein LBH94_01050 [Deltaproteobacteria bacterium]|jgi:hypothetical protein|nr:hypothetical protein [Deltaproteobacteria bacterium]
MRLLPVTIFYGKEPLFAKYAVISAQRAFGGEFTVLVDTLPKPARAGYCSFQEYASDDLTLFKNAYQHRSVNGFESELFCFLRWFHLRDYARACGCTHILHFDHDVLVCGTRKEILGGMRDYDLCISQLSGHTSYFTLGALEALCDFFLHFVQDGYKEHIQRNIGHYASLIENRAEFAISDMTAIKEFYDDSSLRKTNAPFGVMVNVNLREHGCLLNGKTGILDLYVSSRGVFAKKETGEYVPYFTLHFQGAAKRHLHPFYKFYLHHVEAAQADAYVQYCA